jgi:hypothetical protein
MFLITVIDLKVIRASVDFIFDYLFPSAMATDIQSTLGPLARFDILDSQYLVKDDPELYAQLLEIKSKEAMRSGATTLLGAFMDKQQCWERAACILGTFASGMSAKDVAFM